jgi:general secretion pathway protein D
VMLSSGIFRKIQVLLGIFLATAAVAGCMTEGRSIPDQTVDMSGGPSSKSLAALASYQPHGSTSLSADQNPVGMAAPIIVRGSGDDTDAVGSIKPVDTIKPGGAAKNGEYVLNFDNADIREVVKAVLSEMLGASYTIDPAVQGSITLHTAKPLSRDAVLPAFEEALKLAGAAVVSGASGYQIVPLQAAAQRGALGSNNALQPGYQVRIVPLRYITTAEVQRALESLVSPGTVVPGDARGGFVTLTGTTTEVERAERAIALFDVDWLRKQSFGLFPLKYSSAKNVADDLSDVVGKQGPLSGLVRITAIEHLNCILVVSSNYTYIEEMRGWIERFDRGKDVLKPRLFVYHVQNSRARDLATVLTRVFSQARGTNNSSATDDDASAARDSIAPAKAFGASLGPEAAPMQAGTSAAAGATGSIGAASSAAASNDPTAGANGSGDLRITADEVNNSLLIMTTPVRYAQVEDALARLDVVPLQVLLEASIVEVNINDNFKYGVQAAIQKGSFSSLSSSVAASVLSPSTGGLSAAILGNNIQLTLDLLSTYSKLRVISAPKILVLNNRMASIQVGDQVPIATSSAVSTITPNAPTVNTIQLYDTGIILRVTPRVNRSGLVQMDLSQEVSASVPTSSSSINSPTIQQRRVSTSVAVADGQTIAIGGLMSDSRTNSMTGVPGLKDLPGVGPLFGESNDLVDRTELMVLISPHVIRSLAEADAATDELSAKLPLLQTLRPSRPR